MNPLDPFESSTDEQKTISKRNAGFGAIVCSLFGIALTVGLFLVISHRESENMVRQYRNITLIAILFFSSIGIGGAVYMATGENRFFRVMRIVGGILVLLALIGFKLLKYIL